MNYPMMILICLMLATCGERPKGTYLTLKILFSQSNGQLLAPGEIPSGVSSLRVTLYDASWIVIQDRNGNDLSRTFSLDDDYLLIENVPAASQVIVRLEGLDDSSNITHRIDRTDVTIEDQSITNLGTMTLTELADSSSDSSSEGSTDSSGEASSSDGSSSDSSTDDSSDSWRDVLPGDGSEESPFQLSDATNLTGLSALCGSASTIGCSSHYVLTQDINMQDVSLLQTMIGDYDSGTAFTGTFDGAGFTISNINISFVSESGIGIFAHLGSGGVIKDLNVSNLISIGSENVGGLVGYSEGTISNCHIDGSVNGKTSIGGMVGFLAGGTISLSSSSVAVSGSSREVGGLVGTIQGGSISSSSATGQVTGSALKSGGLVGEVTSSTAASITSSFATGDVTGQTYAGGLVGHTNGTLTVTQSHSTGTVTGSGSTELTLGGLIGKITGDQISTSYSSSTISGSGIFVTESNSGVGGLIGLMTASSSVTDCYATGSVSGASGSPGGGLIGQMNSGSVIRTYAIGGVSNSSKKGGLIGDYDSGTLTANFWNVTTSGQSNAYDGSSGSAAGIVIKSSSEMQDQSTFTVDGWDFTSTWQLSSGAFPTLR